jgi:hypothetical protein
MRINFIEETDDFHDKYQEEQLQRQNKVLNGSKDLEYVSQMFQDITMGLLDKMTKYFFWTILVASFLVYYFFEEKTENTAQAIYFFIGAYSQIKIGRFIFTNYRIYDPRIIFLSR